MAAEQLDIIIEQGANLAQLWEVHDRDLSTGYTFAAKLRTSHAASTVVLSITSFTVAKSGNHTHISCNVAAATTANLAAPSMGVYDLEATKTSDGTVLRVYEGSYFTTPEATR